LSDSQSRRDFLKNATLTAASAAVVLGSLGSSVASEPVPSLVMPQTFNKGIPTGKLGSLSVSRLFLGCNQVSGYGHCRDLSYVHQLMREYETDERVLNTWQLCEEQGINTVLSDPFEKPVRIMKRYRKERGGKIQWISEVHPAMAYDDVRLTHMKENLKQVLDNGPDALYIQGGVCDAFVERGLMEELGETLELMKKTGLPSGFGAHSIECPKACAKAGLQPDFFMKTYHADDYFSATPREKRVEFVVDHDERGSKDNMWDIYPEATRQWMGHFRKPWIAFKVMAAGAIPPEKALRFAFEGGADFVCAGMFDFQIAEDVSIVKKVLADTQNRTRPWLA
jgi:hypothetical protein